MMDNRRDIQILILQLDRVKNKQYKKCTIWYFPNNICSKIRKHHQYHYLVSLTIILFPSILKSFNALTASYASEVFSISTNPNPLDFLLVRSIITFAVNTAPCFSKVCFNFSLLKDDGSDPTNNFVLNRNLLLLINKIQD